MKKLKILKSISATLKGVSRSIIAMAMLAFVLVGCQYEEYSPYESKAILRYTILTYQAHTINGSTVGDPTYSWSVKVLSGGDFCQPESNTGRVGQKFYLRIGKNEGDEVRSATIRITFSDGYSNTFSVRQLPETANPEYDHPWAEQPEYLQNNDYIYKTYYTTLGNGDDVRNFSICYDMTKMCSRWVAYPAHTVYTDGRSYDTGGTTAGRTNAWAFDDAVTRYKSSSHYNTSYEITSKYVESIDSYDTYTLPIIPQRRQPDIVYQNGFGWGWARGHMLPSSCRYSTWNTNAQTCYATNIMAQAYDFNGEVWTRVEEKERAEICADTLFVVTGTLFEDNETISSNGRVVGVPSHCYKVFLRTKLGKTGKHIMDITSADELKSIGFLYENSNSETRTPAETAVSVAEIEERAGFKFFQNLNPKIADKVKAQKNLKDWGL